MQGYTEPSLVLPRAQVLLADDRVRPQQHAACHYLHHGRSFQVYSPAILQHQINSSWQRHYCSIHWSQDGDSRDQNTGRAGQGDGNPVVCEWFHVDDLLQRKPHQAVAIPHPLEIRRRDDEQQREQRQRPEYGCWSCLGHRQLLGLGRLVHHPGDEHNSIK